MLKCKRRPTTKLSGARDSLPGRVSRKQLLQSSENQEEEGGDDLRGRHQVRDGDGDGETKMGMMMAHGPYHALYVESASSASSNHLFSPSFSELLF